MLVYTGDLLIKYFTHRAGKCSYIVLINGVKITTKVLCFTAESGKSSRT